MAHPVLAGTSRIERRRILATEMKARKTGEWGEWELLTFPVGTVGRGWASEFTRAHRNRCFCVLDRTLADGTRHLAITSLSEERPTWRETQRIKDTIAGPGSTAVEVYPPASEVVDDANMYHLWVLTADLPFSLASRVA